MSSATSQLQYHPDLSTPHYSDHRRRNNHQRTSYYPLHSASPRALSLSRYNEFTSACAFKRGYDIVQKVCLVPICPKKCENKLRTENSKASVICARFQNCFVNVVTCEKCCKRRKGKKKISPTVFIKRQTFQELKSKNQSSKTKEDRRTSKGNLLNESNSKSSGAEQETRYPERSLDKSMDSAFFHQKSREGDEHLEISKSKSSEQDNISQNTRNDSLTIRQVAALKINASHARRHFLQNVHRNMSQLTEVHKEKMKEVVELCTICIEEMHRGEIGTILTACKHIFHSHCIEQYIENNQRPECPMCSTFIKDSVKIELY